jgi:hypothetical protein
VIESTNSIRELYTKRIKEENKGKIGKIENKENKERRREERETRRGGQW